jgi:hypothetical protein
MLVPADSTEFVEHWLARQGKADISELFSAIVAPSSPTVTGVSLSAVVLPFDTLLLLAKQTNTVYLKIVLSTPRNSLGTPTRLRHQVLRSKKTNTKAPNKWFPACLLAPEYRTPIST